MKELTAAHILISKLEYKLKQERHAKLVQADLIMTYQSGPPPQPTMVPPVQCAAPFPPASATSSHTSAVQPYQQQQQPTPTYPTAMPYPTHPYQNCLKTEQKETISEDAYLIIEQPGGKKLLPPIPLACHIPHTP